MVRWLVVERLNKVRVKVCIGLFSRTERSDCCREVAVRKGLTVFFFLSRAIPIKCFVSHRPPSREGGLVGRAKKRNEHMIGSECQ